MSFTINVWPAVPKRHDLTVTDSALRAEKIQKGCGSETSSFATASGEAGKAYSPAKTCSALRGCRQIHNQRDTCSAPSRLRFSAGLCSAVTAPSTHGAISDSCARRAASSRGNPALLRWHQTASEDIKRQGKLWQQQMKPPPQKGKNSELEQACLQFKTHAIGFYHPLTGFKNSTESLCSQLLQTRRHYATFLNYTGTTFRSAALSPRRRPLAAPVHLSARTAPRRPRRRCQSAHHRLGTRSAPPPPPARHQQVTAAGSPAGTWHWQRAKRGRNACRPSTLRRAAGFSRLAHPGGRRRSGCQTFPSAEPTPRAAPRPLPAAPPGSRSQRCPRAAPPPPYLRCRRGQGVVQQLHRHLLRRAGRRFGHVALDHWREAGQSRAPRRGRGGQSRGGAARRPSAPGHAGERAGGPRRAGGRRRGPACCLWGARGAAPGDGAPPAAGAGGGQGAVRGDEGKWQRASPSRQLPGGGRGAAPPSSRPSLAASPLGAAGAGEKVGAGGRQGRPSRSSSPSEGRRERGVGSGAVWERRCPPRPAVPCPALRGPHGPACITSWMRWWTALSFSTTKFCVCMVSLHLLEMPVHTAARAEGFPAGRWDGAHCLLLYNNGRTVLTDFWRVCSWLGSGVTHCSPEVVAGLMDEASEHIGTQWMEWSRACPLEKDLLPLGVFLGPGLAACQAAQREGSVSGIALCSYDLLSINNDKSLNKLWMASCVLYLKLQQYLKVI